MLVGLATEASAGSSATALAESQAAYNGFRQMFEKVGPGHVFPEATDPAVAAVLAAAWNTDLLWTPDAVEIANLEALDSICRNGMIMWKAYLFEDIDRLESLDEVLSKRMVRYQAEVGPGIAFSIRCAASFIDAYETTLSGAADQKGAYSYWVDAEQRWIPSAFGIVCAGLFANENSRPLTDALHAVLPGLIALDRRTFDRDALLKSARDAMAGAPVMPGARGRRGCRDLQALLTAQPEGNIR
ncbi:hypothetical protein [Inquilinus limosus]|nr:hypothetical protein [Inquilinus limosus]